MKRKITAMLLCLAMILAMLPTLVLAANPGSIKIDKNHYAPGERMTVTISGVTTKLYNGLYGYAAIFNDEGKEVFGLEAIEVTQDGVYFAQAPWDDDDGVGNYEIRLYTGGSYYEEYLAGTVSFTIDANIISDDMGDYSWAGTWNIDWDSNDTMTLTQNGYDVAGKIVEDTTTYTVTDKIQGNVFHGRWSDDGKTPDYPYYGGHHGPMIMWMSEDGKSFTGFWGYEAGGPPYGWSPLKGSRGAAVPIGATPPATQQPTTQQPTTQQPTTQQPATQQPATQQPATQQPATQQPATQPTGQFTLTATPVGESEAFAGVELNWTALSGITYYRIFRAETSGGYTIPLTDFDIQGTTFTDVNIASNKTYYYIVKPVISHSDDGLSDVLGNASNEAKVFIPLAIGGSSGAIAGGAGYIRMKVDSTTINVNGENKQIDTAPVIVNGRTMVPARAIVEGMNGTAEWNPGTQQVTLKALGKTVVMTIGSTSYTIDGAQKTMDVAPVIKDGRTLIPLRFAGEALGCTVNWLQKTREILIVYSLSGAAISQPLATEKPAEPTPQNPTAATPPDEETPATVTIAQKPVEIKQPAYTKPGSFAKKIPFADRLDARASGLTVEEPVVENPVVVEEPVDTQPTPEPEIPVANPRPHTNIDPNMLGTWMAVTGDYITGSGTNMGMLYKFFEDGSYYSYFIYESPGFHGYYEEWGWFEVINNGVTSRITFSERVQNFTPLAYANLTPGYEGLALPDLVEDISYNAYGQLGLKPLTDQYYLFFTKQ